MYLTCTWSPDQVIVSVVWSSSHFSFPFLPATLQQPDESFGMNVAGGMGGQVGDLPVYISAIRPESAVARSGRIQVSGFGCVREGGREGGKNGGCEAEEKYMFT